MTPEERIARTRRLAIESLRRDGEEPSEELPPDVVPLGEIIDDLLAWMESSMESET